MGAWTTLLAERAVDVLLIGGGVASVRCARALRRHGFDGSILLVGDEQRPPYNRPPLSKELLRDDLPDELLQAEPSAWYERRSVELRTGSPVVAFDADGRRAMLADGTVIAYGRCLLATGAELRRLSVPGGGDALMLRTAADARRLRAAATAARGEPVVVIGGGFIGLEVASGLALLGLRPVVVEMTPTLWGGTLGTLLADWASRRLGEAGIELRLGAAVSSIGDGEVRVGEERLSAAFVVAGIGVKPREGLAAEAGLDVGDGIVVGAEQRTSHPAAWAAGDVARVGGSRVEHWHAAREAGERAALSMLGQPVPDRPPDWVFSEIAGSMLDVVGDVSGWDAEEWLDPDRLLVYLRDGRPIGVASIDGRLATDTARRLLSGGTSVDDLIAAARGDDPIPRN
jgi:NADPH-dependent 2,4-dienoyl-CoA reductase/sulfur reductase-like enzyme